MTLARFAGPDAAIALVGMSDACSWRLPAVPPRFTSTATSTLQLPPCCLPTGAARSRVRALRDGEGQCGAPGYIIVAKDGYGQILAPRDEGDRLDRSTHPRVHLQLGDWCNWMRPRTRSTEGDHSPSRDVSGGTSGAHRSAAGGHRRLGLGHDQRPERQLVAVGASDAPSLRDSVVQRMRVTKGGTVAFISTPRRRSAAGTGGDHGSPRHAGYRRRVIQATGEDIDRRFLKLADGRVYRRQGGALRSAPL